jgi:hypothetical protein
MSTIDKPAAAERLILAAIAMSDCGEDPLAIHVVAASALSLLRELIEKGGDNYVAKILRQGLFTAATARSKDEPITLPTGPEIDSVIDQVVEAIRTGDVNQPEDLQISLGKDELRDMLGYITRPFNFMKHAQRDPLATLDDTDLDPDGVIVHALTAYSMINPDKGLPDSVKPFLEKHGLA